MGRADGPRQRLKRLCATVSAGAGWLQTPRHSSCVHPWCSGRGKPEFAKSHGRCPLLVKTLDGLKKIRPGATDLLVFDDMNFGPGTKEHPGLNLTADQAIALLTQNNRVTLKTRPNCRGDDVEIPANMKRIFTIDIAGVFSPKNICYFHNDTIIRIPCCLCVKRIRVFFQIVVRVYAVCCNSLRCSGPYCTVAKGEPTRYCISREIAVKNERFIVYRLFGVSVRLKRRKDARMLQNL